LDNHLLGYFFLGPDGAFHLTALKLINKNLPFAFKPTDL
jgi:hypothetical protein